MRIITINVGGDEIKLSTYGRELNFICSNRDSNIIPLAEIIQNLKNKESLYNYLKSNGKLGVFHILKKE